MSVGENRMNLTLTLSLEQWTLANIAITLWNHDDVRDLMSKSALCILHENWNGIKNEVIEKSLKLQLSKMLNEKLLGFIGRVGLQILSWVDFHHCNCSLVKLPAMFVWTSLGTINNIKTAKLLLKSGTLGDDRSFALACMYCLENEIKYYCNILIRTEFNYKSIDFALYWIIYMYQLEKKELSEKYEPILMLPRRDFILKAIKSGNEAATRYFFNMHKHTNYCNFKKLSAKVIALELFYLRNVTSLQRYSDVMLFMLSEMNAEGQANMIMNHTFAFLKCLLVWPWHSLFLEMSKDKWNSLSKNEYKNLLYSMVHLMRYDHTLHKLFVEFWQQSPEAYKQFLTDKDHIVHLLIGIYARGNGKCLMLISKDSSILTTKNIFKIESKPIFLHLISSKKWDLIKILIKHCLSSIEDLIRFRDVFKNHVQQLLSENKFCKESYSKFKLIEEYQWVKFFQVVDDCISIYNIIIRSTEIYNSSFKRRNVGVYRC